MLTCPRGIRRPRTAALTAVLATSLTAVSLLAVQAATSADAATSLKALAEARGRYFGTALTVGDVRNTAQMNVAVPQFDMVTPGNEMKWDSTEPSNGSFTFSAGDQIQSFAASHSMRVRGHNLVWHAQLPSWVSSLPTSSVQGVMERHITTEATHYRGKVYAWDVINEPFNEDGSLRQDVFYRAMGQGYLADAIRTAHTADPAAKLYINDYNIEGVNAKSDALYALAKSMLAQGVPLHGIGLESHFIVGQVPSSLLTNMQRFAALGLDVAITELDDRMRTPASSADLQQQARDYAAVVNACLAVSRCVGISQWGVDDGHSWIPGTFPGYGAATFYDANYQPKPAYDATVAALSAGPVSSPPVSSPPVSSPPVSSPPPAGSSCRVSATVNAWNTGLTENLTVTNTGSTALNGWSLGFTLPSGQVITGGWNATYSPTSGAVTARSLSYNGSLAPGASTSIGFQATHTGSTGAASQFTLNGASCTTA